MNFYSIARLSTLTLLTLMAVSCSGIDKPLVQTHVPAGMQDDKKAPTMPSYRLSARLEPLANYHYMAGYMAELEGNIEAAVKNYQKVLLIDPGAMAIKKRIASVLYQVNQSEDALRLAEEAITAYPDDLELLNILGQSYSNTNQTGKAIEAFKKMAELAPDNPEPQLNLAVLYGASREYELALETLEPLLESGNRQTTISAMYYIGVLAISENDLKVAEQFLLRAGKLGHFSEGITLNLGAIYDKQNKVELAEEYYKKTIKLNPKSVPALDNLSQLYLKHDRLKESLEIMDMLLVLQPQNTSTLKRRALVLLNLRDYRESANALNTIIPLIPQDTSLRYYLGISYEELGEYDKAIDEYRKMIIVAPTDVKPYLSLGYLYSQMDMDDKAVEVYLDLLDVAENPMPEYYIYLSRAYSTMTDNDKALETLQNGLIKFEDNADMHFAIGAIYDKLSDMENMEKHMRLAIELNPEQADAMNFLGYSLTEQDRELDYALSLINKALEIKPGNGYITDSLGWTYFKMGKLDMAIETLLKAASLVNNDPVIYEHLGDVYEASGKMQEALDAWQHSLKVLKAGDMQEPYSTELRQRIQDKIRGHDTDAAPAK